MKSQALALAFALIAGNAVAQDADPPWMLQLKAQLKGDENCTLLYTTSMHEFELQGRVVLSGRAHCSDGRAFDVERKSEGARFLIKACQPVIC